MTESQSSLGVSCLALTLAFSALGCDQEPTHDLGYTSSDLTNEPAPALPPVAVFMSDFDGVWIGEADDPLALAAGADDDPPPYRFPSGSTRIRLEMGSLDSRITFGEGEPPPPAADPNVGYPPDPDFGAADFDRGAQDRSMRPPVEGFSYAAGPFYAERDVGIDGFEAALAFFVEGRLLDGKLDLSFALTEVFGSWCALQVAGSCPGVGQIAWNTETNECSFGDDFTPIDCHKLALCASQVCSCPEDGSPCWPTGENQSANLTIRLSDDGLVGVFSGAVFVNERGFQQPLGTVHFRRESSPADAGAP
jgi:hypothetical protein